MKYFAILVLFALVALQLVTAQRGGECRTPAQASAGKAKRAGRRAAI